MEQQANNYFTPELVFELTKMMVSEFGFLQPGEELTKQLKYYQQNNWRVDKIPECYRRYLSNSVHAPNIHSNYLREFMGALMDATGEYAVQFISHIVDVALVEDTITIFLDLDNDKCHRVAMWFFHGTTIDREKLDLYKDKFFDITNRKPNRV